MTNDRLLRAFQRTQLQPAITVMFSFLEAGEQLFLKKNFKFVILWYRQSVLNKHVLPILTKLVTFASERLHHGTHGSQLADYLEPEWGSVSVFLPEGLIVWGPCTNPCVCVRSFVRPFVRSSVRPSGLFLDTFWIEKTHESKGFGPET